MTSPLTILLTDDLLQRFDAWLAGRHISPLSRRAYACALEVVAGSARGEIPLDLREADRAVEEAGGTRSTRHKRRTALHRFIDFQAEERRVRQTAEEQACAARSRSQTPILLQDREWLREQYVDLRRSTRDIGDQCGRSHTAVLRALKKHDIPRRQSAAGRPATRKPKAPQDWRRRVDRAIASALATALENDPTEDVLIVPVYQIVDPLVADPAFAAVQRGWIRGEVGRALRREGLRVRSRGIHGALSYLCPREIAERLAGRVGAGQTVAPTEEASA